MKLEKIKYSQFAGQLKEWSLELLEFEDTNLLVGKNASGKSKTLNIIIGLARLLSGQIQPTFVSGRYDVVFDQDGKKLHYLLNIENSKVTSERFDRDGTNLLERGAGGVGKLWAEKQKEYIEFQTPESQLAAIARRDSIQHPFFEFLCDWGKSVYYFPFGSTLGKDTLAVFIKDPSKKPSEPRNADEVVAIFRKGSEEIGAKFLDSVKQGMRDIGYPIESIHLAPPISINLQVQGIDNSPKEISCLCVKEQNLTALTDQIDMSQGMFRALSIIIQITYAEMISHPSCIVIDDIGEGLDFDRSSTLIELLVKRANQSRIQLIMATNDRFIMNKVPLKTWTILHREASHIHAYNYKNSKQLFDQFEITGLNNFDFFSLGFVKQQTEVK